jgi:hypothetical protein
MDIYPPATQRPELLKLAAALDSSDLALRRDECGDWHINGKRGYICTILGTLDEPNRPGFQMYVAGQSARHWASSRRTCPSPR